MLVEPEAVFSDRNASRPQAAAPSHSAAPVPAAPRLDSTDKLLLQRVTDMGPCPTWSLITGVTSALAHGSREATRLTRLDLWYRIKRLRRWNLIFGLGRNEITAEPDPRQRLQQPLRRRSRGRRHVVSVGGSHASDGGSAITRQGTEKASGFVQAAHSELQKRDHAPAPGTARVGKTKSAPTPEMVSAAAIGLARLPRHPRRIWSGWIGKTRAFQDMPIVLPDGQRAWVYGARRQKVVFTFDRGRLLGTLTPGQRWGVIDASEVQPIRNADAVALARSKRGHFEVQSLLKAQTARDNGRRGGRPRKLFHAGQRPLVG